MFRILLALLAAWHVRSSPTLIDSSGSLQAQRIPDTKVVGGGKKGAVITIVSSPGTPSALVDNGGLAPDVSLSLDENAESIVLYAKGAVLAGASEADDLALQTVSLVSNVLLLDGVTAGDVEAGLAQTRHARTLLSLFRARVRAETTNDDDSDSGRKIKQQQTLVMGLIGEGVQEEGITEEMVREDIKKLYNAAVVAENKQGKTISSFEQAYNIQVVSVATVEDAQKAMASAKEIVQPEDLESSSPMSLSSALVRAHAQAKKSSPSTTTTDPPSLAAAYFSIGSAFNKHSRTVRASMIAWNSRVSRGLWVDGFGREATALRERVLTGFDSDTMTSSGFPLVAPYRLERRAQLQSMVDTAIEQAFTEQISNLEKSTLRRFEAQMLRTVNDPAESIVDTNAAALRTEAYNFEAVAEDLEVPDLGLTKDKVVREMSSKLNDSLMAFPDGPAAKMKRTKKVDKIVKKEKKPNQRGFDFGLDLVAVLRPDGFGSLQGFAGYQIGGNSITFGIHNDADDPQVIAQFGGVRPPLLRVQPKLRVDIEL